MDSKIVCVYCEVYLILTKWHFAVLDLVKMILVYILVNGN